MTVLPVIARELRAAARRPSTYGLRINGVLFLLGAIVWITGDLRWHDGGIVFAYLHRALFLATWVLVPLLTADCISRERREGTLPLLFLTPLKAGDIVLAKVLAHGLTAFTLWLAALPVLTIPFVMGGVGWPQGVSSILVNFSSLCLALGAGLVASAHSKAPMRALMLAGVLGLLFCLGLVLVTGAAWFATAILGHLYTGRPTDLLNELSVSTLFGTGTWAVLNGRLPFSALASGVTTTYALRSFGVGQVRPSSVLGSVHLIPPTPQYSVWQVLPSSALGPAVQTSLLVALALSATLSVLALCLLFGFAASRVKHIWREPPPSPQNIWFEKKFCTPLFFRRLFRRWMNWELERNPVGWLERRSWSGRLVMWSWFAIVVSVYTSVLTNFDLYRTVFHFTQRFLASVLMGSLAVSAAGSFRRERECGMLELLLVAPLREWQILGGRVRGLWAQFLPAFVLLLCLWLYCSTFLRPSSAPSNTPSEWRSILFFAGTFLTLPVIGLYFSLLKRGFVGAFLWTLLAGVALPAFASQV